MTEKRYNARRNEDNNDFQDRLKAELEDIIGIVHTDEPTDSVELKKEYYCEQSKNKHYTYLDYSKDKYIGSFFCNDVMLRTDEVVELLNENEQLKKQIQRLERERRATQKQHLKWSEQAEERIKKLEQEVETLQDQLAHGVSDLCGDVE